MRSHRARPPALLLVALIAACEDQLQEALRPEPKPVIGLSVEQLDFVAVSGRVAPAQLVSVGNAGAGRLEGLKVERIDFIEGTGWLTATLNVAEAPASLLVQPDASGLPPNDYLANIVLTAPDASNSPRKIRVAFTVDRAKVPPIIALSQPSVSLLVPVGGPGGPARVQVWNGGDGTLTGLTLGETSYGPGAADWLTTTLSGADTPATLTLVPNLTALSVGTYTAVVPVFAAGAANSPRSVSVSLEVSAAAIPPSIALAPASLSFTAILGSNPGSQPVQVTNGGDNVLSGLSIGTVTYGPGASGWLLATVGGSTAPATVTVAPNTRSLAAGSYTAAIPVFAAGASNSPLVIPVTLTIIPAPAAPTIVLSTTSLGFAGVTGGSLAAQVVDISNGGGGTLNGLTVSGIGYGPGAAGWCNAAISGATAPARLTVQPTIGSLGIGTYTATITLAAAGATNSPRTVQVTMTVSSAASPPSIGLSNGSAGFVATVGGPPPSAQVISITNGGGGTLSGLTLGAVSYGGGASGWLTASLAATSAPTSLNLAVIPAGLAAGSYTATVPIQSGAASNSPRTVTVTLMVNPAAQAPAIALAPTSQAFSATVGGANPAAKTVAVSNGGGGTLSGLSVGTVTYGAGASGWLTATLSGTSAPSTLTLQPATGTVTAGSYTASVPITGAGAANSPQIVAVTLTVSAGGGMSFATDVYPILQANCLGSGCHGNNQNSPFLDTQARAFSQLTAGTKYLTASDSTRGLLVRVMEWRSGYKKMPPNAKLSQAVIDKIKLWIHQGAKNN